MGKSNYLIHFQKYLRDSIETLIRDQWGYDLMVNEEDGNMVGIFHGYMDISIYDPEILNSVVGIEIEHKSDYYQAHQNIHKLKSWTHNSKYRSSSLLHIFNEECNISIDNICELVRYAINSERKNRGFYYDFVFYSESEVSLAKQNVEKLVKSKDFQTRLWMLLEDCGLV